MPMRTSAAGRLRARPRTRDARRRRRPRRSTLARARAARARRRVAKHVALDRERALGSAAEVDCRDTAPQVGLRDRLRGRCAAQCGHASGGASGLDEACGSSSIVAACAVAVLATTPAASATSEGQPAMSDEHHEGARGAAIIAPSKKYARPSYGTTRSIVIESPAVPGSTVALDPVRSPLVGTALPLAETRASTITSLRARQRHARRHRHRIVEHELERQLARGLAQHGERHARALRGARVDERAWPAAPRATRARARSSTRPAMRRAGRCRTRLRRGTPPACAAELRDRRADVARVGAVGRQRREQRIPVADRGCVVASLHRGRRGERQRLRVLRVDGERLRHDLGRLARELASLRHRECVGPVGERIGVAGEALGRLAVGVGRLLVTLQRRVRATEQQPALRVVRLRLHALGEALDDRDDLAAR